MGSVQEDRIIDALMAGKDLNAIVVREIMDPPFPVVKLESGIEQISAILGHEAHAILVESNGSYEIITKYDLVHSML
ncbi:MAG: hypothetical protein HYU64_15395 [Armatimonadetes bacterium]|nr:hypothetical protein [Armatimonadota bacterium]